MRALKTILFHVLYTFRGLVLIICKLFSGLFLVGFLLFFFMGTGLPIAYKLVMLLLSVGFGMLAWYYDVLLLKLQPENIDLILMK